MTKSVKGKEQPKKVLAIGHHQLCMNWMQKKPESIQLKHVPTLNREKKRLVLTEGDVRQEVNSTYCDEDGYVAVYPFTEWLEQNRSSVNMRFTKPFIDSQ